MAGLINVMPSAHDAVVHRNEVDEEFRAEQVAAARRARGAAAARAAKHRRPGPSLREGCRRARCGRQGKRAPGCWATACACGAGSAARSGGPGGAPAHPYGLCRAQAEALAFARDIFGEHVPHHCHDCLFNEIALHKNA